MKNYIPKNKFDFEAVESLNSLSFEAVRSDIPELLKWLQDMNWPVAHKIAEYLAPHINEMKDELLYILNSDDGMWKYWIISLIGTSQIKPDTELMFALKRVSDHPSRNEIEDEVDQMAKDALNNLLD